MGNLVYEIPKRTECNGKKFLQKFISSTETRQECKYSRRVPYYKAMAEMKNKKTTLCMPAIYAEDVG